MIDKFYVPFSVFGGKCQFNLKIPVSNSNRAPTGTLPFQTRRTTSDKSNGPTNYCKRRRTQQKRKRKSPITGEGRSWPGKDGRRNSSNSKRYQFVTTNTISSNATEEFDAGRTHRHRQKMFQVPQTTDHNKTKHLCLQNNKILQSKMSKKPLEGT